MKGNPGCAWVVPVPNDGEVEKAIDSGQILRKTNSCGSILALVSSKISKLCISKLETSFDLIIVKDVDLLSDRLCTATVACPEIDSLLIAALGMTAFSKLVIIRPGITLLEQSDQLFDEDNVAILNSSGDWQAVVFSPDKKKHASILENLGKNGLTLLSRPSDIMNLIFSGKWKICTEKGMISKTNDIHIQSEILPPRNETDDTSGWVAIVGMSCRFPNANSPQEYWDILSAGENTSMNPPEHRRKLVDLDPKMKGNFLKCPVDQFDASFFGLSPSEAIFTDPQARLLLEVSWEALEDAAINPEKLKASKTGVFYGSWLQEYRDAMNAEGSPINEDFIRKYIGNSFGCSAAKLSFFYGFTGPNISTESGCSSSMVAVDLAIQSLQRRECPIAMVAGANVLLHMDMKQKVLWAEDGKSRTFDADANGYARAEGVAVLILKRFSDAKRDGDRIHAIIRGTAVSQEGLSKSFGTPTVDSECAAMKGALANANVQPWEVDYVEAHATGTAVGDPIEAQAIVKAYSSQDEGDKRKGKPLYIGSGKTNVGHTESCSGMAGIFKVVLALKNEMIPPHINLNKMNPQVNFDAIPGRIPTEAVPWPKDKSGGRPRIGGVSSFGITGTDVHVIIQEAPEETRDSNGKPETLIPIHLLTLSAKSEGALEEYTKLCTTYLDDTTATIDNIAYTANVCRPHHPFRMAVLGRTKEELKHNLVEGMCSRGKANAPKICFTFPGRIGLMDLEPARILYRTSPVFRETMDYCDQLLQNNNGISMIPLLTNEQEDTVAKGVSWYALILGVQYSLVMLWASWGIQPDCVIGHCIGEICAAVVSGAMQLEDIFKLVTCMEYFLQVDKDQPALMMAVQAPRNKVEELIMSFLNNNFEKNNKSWIDVASSNAFDQTVVAGDAESIENFKKFLKDRAYRCKVLVMDFCAHSRAVEPACQKSLPVFQSISHQKMKIPYVSSVTGQVVQDDEMNGNHWCRVFRQCVNFTESCRTVNQNGLADVYIEMGLEGALSKLTQENLAVLKGTPTNTETCLPSLWKFKGDKCWLGLLASLGQLYTLGGNVNWEAFYDGQEHGGHYKKVDLPHYPFQRKSFWYERRKKNNEMIQQCITKGITQLKENLHPLLDGQLETCVEDLVVYQGMINNDGPADYLYDHVIGSEVIFPGAAFLECILAAAVNVDTHKYIHVDGFVVSSPLHLEQSIPKRIQCLLDTKKQAGRVYSYHRKVVDDPPLWKLHASGDYQVDEKMEMENIGTLDEIMTRVSEMENATKLFYLSAQQVGLEFGTSFQSMRKIFQGKNGEESLIEVGLPPTEGEAKNYICHPVLIDAMIQGFILHTKPELKRLHVPVRIGRFSTRTGMMGVASHLDKWYVYCKTNIMSGQAEHVYLMNDHGEILASMKNAELVATSTDSILKAAGCLTTEQKKKLEEVSTEPVTLDQYYFAWQRSQFHQSGTSIQLWRQPENCESQLLNDLQTFIETKNLFSEEEHRLDQNMNRLCSLYVFKAFLELGWLPSKDNVEALVGNAEQWGIVPGLVPAYNHFISFLDSQILEEIGGNYETLNQEIDKLLSELKNYAALLTVQACGSQLAGILQGKVNPHGVLFGTMKESTTNTLAEHYYENSRFIKTKESLSGAFKAVDGEIQRAKVSSSDTIRILEVGGGMGMFAGSVQNYAKDQDDFKYEYTFTDISPSFVARAKETFTDGSFIFKIVNIEQDPLKQGLCPEYFDIVVAYDVLHATRDVKESLKNLARVTKPGGFIIIKETEKPVKEVDICFGIFDGYWLFEDGIRKTHCTLSADQWLALLQENGFSQKQTKFLSCNNQMSVITAQKEQRVALSLANELTVVGTWLLFTTEDIDTNTVKYFTSKMCQLGRHVSLVNLSQAENLESTISECMLRNHGSLEGIIFLLNEAFSEEIAPSPKSFLEPLFYLGKILTQKKWKLVLPKFHVVTRGCLLAEPEIKSQEGNSPSSAMAWGFLRNLRIELPGIVSKTIDIERETGAEIFGKQLISELWLDDKETEIAFRGGARYVRRSFPNEPPTSTDVEIFSKYYCVDLPKSKMISDLRFVSMEEPKQLAPDEILVEVKSVSLNFKDVLAVMKPSSDFDDITSIGLDFAGVVTSKGSQVTKWAVGQPVFGCGWEKGAMKSHLVTKENAVVSVPKWMTFNEAATLPAVWITAWYCIAEVAQLQKGQTLLVHAISGGVGLIALQIANLLGVQVIGTAGTEKKRNFLKRLGVQHVFNSRTTEFAQQIQQVTYGSGVDMVLNCLTGPGFKEASLQVCKDGGHFVEISKLDIWTPDQVQEMRPKVHYTIVDATQVNKSLVQDMLNKLTSLLEEGSIKPLPYTQYTASKIKDALSYLQKAKQIGKVIVTMPQYEQQENEGYLKNYLFNDRSSYLITGGKGAIGLSVAKWMVTQGAKYIVLAGRSPVTQSGRAVIEDMEQNYGAVIICREMDISDFESCRQLLNELKYSGKIPPLRGIHHCAGTLSDKLLSQHDTWSNYEPVLTPKVQGTWNLHQLTKQLPLEYFVLYSSAASTFGNIGQSNYVSANCYLDSLAEMRVAMGLPALSINWGQWNVGFAKDLSIDWLHPFTPDEGVCALENLMTAKNPPCVVAGLFDFFGLLRMTPYFKDTLFNTICLEQASFLGRGASKVELPEKKDSKDAKTLFIKHYQTETDENMRSQLVQDFVIRVLCETLGTKPDEVQDYDQHFSEMGMDSLMSIEFANKLNAELEESSANAGFIDLEEYGTVNKMTTMLRETLAKSMP